MLNTKPRYRIFLLSLILLLVAALPLFSACNSDVEEPEDTSASEQPTQTEKNDDGINRIFADGDFACRFIRPEVPTDEERAVFDALRDELSEITGKRPRLSTDFLAAGESYDDNEFAIIVGRTGFEESKQLYSELGFGECRIQLIGRKLVIGFLDTEVAMEAIYSLGDILASAFKDGEIIADESIRIAKVTDEIITKLPAYGNGIIEGVVAGGNGSNTAVIGETSLEDYQAYLSSLSSENGYTLYAENTIENNRYATYVSEQYVITAIHTPVTSQTRLTIETAADNPLPPLEPEVYEVTCDSTVTQMGVESTGRQNGMCYIIKLADGSFMVFDGGDQRCIDLFINTITSLADDPNNITIAAWVITHLHNDHAYMLRDLSAREDFMAIAKVERFIWNRPSKLQMANVGDQSENDELLYQSMKSFEGATVYTAYAGQVYYIRNAVYTVYSSTEMLEPFVMGSYNDANVIGLLEIDGRLLFFPGDSDRTQTTNLVKLYGEGLRCDLLQVIHHGHNGGDTESYMLFDPITVLWPVGSDRYYNEWDGNAPFSEWECNEWFFNEESSVENIYVAGKDIVTLVIKDLPKHDD